MIFSRRVVSELHGVIFESFSFGGNANYRFSSLSSMEMVLTGLVGFKMPKEDLYSVSINLNNLGGRSIYALDTSHTYLDPSYTYLAI